MGRIVVEFYGLARQRAGFAELAVGAGTVRGALDAVLAACPDLQVVRDDGVAPEYLLSLNGVRFTKDLDAVLADGDALLILGADAGG